MVEQGKLGLVALIAHRMRKLCLFALFSVVVPLSLSAGESSFSLSRAKADVPGCAVFALGFSAEALAPFSELSSCGWKLEAVEDSAAGWERVKNGVSDIVLVSADSEMLRADEVHTSASLDAGLSLENEVIDVGSLRSGAYGDMLVQMAEKGRAVVICGLEKDSVLDFIRHRKDSDGLQIVNSGSPEKDGILASGESTLLRYPMDATGVLAPIKSYFKLGHAASRNWRVVGTRGDSKPCALLLQQGAGLVFLSTARIESEEFLCNIAKALELQRLGLTFRNVKMQYGDSETLALGYGRTELGLLNTSGTNLVVYALLRLHSENGERREYWHKNALQVGRGGVSSLSGTVDLHGKCKGEILVGVLDDLTANFPKESPVCAYRFDAELPKFLEIAPPAYRGMISTARRQAAVKFSVILNSVVSSVAGSEIEVEMLDSTGNLIASKSVVATSGGRISLSLPLEKDAPAGLYKLRAKTLRDGVFPELAEAEFKIVPVREGQIFVDQDGVLLADGKPFFPIGLYHVSGHDIPAVAKVGVNMVQFWNWFASKENYETLKKHNIRSIHEDGFWREIVNSAGKDVEYFSFETNKATHARLAKVRDYPAKALGMWYTADEPWVGAVPQIKRLTAMWHQLDEDHPTYIVSTGDPRIGEAADVLGIDVYPVYHGSRRALTCVSDIMSSASLATGFDKPVIAVLQSFGNNKRHGEKPEEVRAMTYLALTHGVRGIFWYCWKESGDNSGAEGAGNHPETVRELTSLCTEIKFVAEALMEPGARLLRSTEGSVHAIICGSERTGRFLIYVNGEYLGGTATLLTPELEGFALHSAFGEKSASVADGKVTLSVKPLETGIFSLTAK